MIFLSFFSIYRFFPIPVSYSFDVKASFQDLGRAWTFTRFYNLIHPTLYSTVLFLQLASRINLVMPTIPKLVQSRKLTSRYGARNQFQEPSLEQSSQATEAGGPVRQPYAYLVPSPHYRGTKVTDTALPNQSGDLFMHYKNILNLLHIPSVPTPTLKQYTIGDSAQSACSIK